MYVVATPLFAAVLLRSRIGALTWVAVLLAVTGLGVLTLGDVSAGLGLGYGEALTLVSALIYALHIVGLGAWSDARDALGMSIVQCIVIAVICTGAAAPGGIVLPRPTADWLSVVYMALFAGAAALLGQTWAQAHLPPTRIRHHHEHGAGLRRALRGAAGWRVGDRCGCCSAASLVLTAMLIVELVPRRKIEAEVTHIAV